MGARVMKEKRKIIEIDENRCDGCGQCVPSCAEGAIQIINGKARLVADKYCDGLGACLGECPMGALNIVEREADEFDQVAAEKHVVSQKPSMVSVEIPMACGCPSTAIRTFSTSGSCENANKPVSQSGGVSALSHWPVQIRLVPPTAPFLKGADLLVAADCTPFAYPRFHEDFLKGKTVLVGCPKLDDTQAYVQKFAQIFREADVKSITALVMEVPCCQGLPVIIQRGMAMAERNIPLEKVVISSGGEVIRRESL
jgi:ferredoxin